jgi:group I intron endonuclease
MFVYKITNTENQRVYVGLTSGSLKKRWAEHLCAARSGSENPLYRAMRKYGAEKFSMHLLYSAASVDEMRQKEIELISKLRAHVVDGGYNLTDHGFQHGKTNQQKGELVYNAKLSEELVAFIRNPDFWDRPNSELLELAKEQFGFSGSRDALRDARRGDSWKHLNSAYAPVTAKRGARKPPLTELQKVKAAQILNEHRSSAVEKSVALRIGKRAANARLSEKTVKDIFYSQHSLCETAKDFGVSKKLVSLIKQRKSHVYLTKEL